MSELPAEVDPRLRLQEEIDEDVDRDQHDRDDRRAIGRDVVLEREQGLGKATRRRGRLTARRCSSAARARAASRPGRRAHSGLRAGGAWGAAAPARARGRARARAREGVPAPHQRDVHDRAALRRATRQATPRPRCAQRTRTVRCRAPAAAATAGAGSPGRGCAVTAPRDGGGDDAAGVGDDAERLRPVTASARPRRRRRWRGTRGARCSPGARASPASRRRRPRAVAYPVAMFSAHPSPGSRRRRCDPPRCARGGEVVVLHVAVGGHVARLPRGRGGQRGGDDEGLRARAARDGR